MKTTARDIYDSFESSFREKNVLPEDLLFQWLLKSIARYSVELEPLSFDKEMKEFESELDQYVIDTLAIYMKQYYIEREVSRVNKIASIVTKDISINGQGNLSKYTKEEYDEIKSDAEQMTANQKPTAFN